MTSFLCLFLFTFLVSGRRKWENNLLGGNLVENNQCCIITRNCELSYEVSRLMELRRTDATNAVTATHAAVADSSGAGGSHTTSSGREVILSWKMRSQQPKDLNNVDKSCPTGKFP
jgi:hypothetical protein